MSSQSNRSQEPFINHSKVFQRNSPSFTPRSKYLLDLYNTAITYHQQKKDTAKKYQPKFSILSQKHHLAESGFKSKSSLPPIQTSKEHSDETVTFSFYKLNKNVYNKV